MQISRIVLFHRDGVRSRPLKLRLGELNVITGVSETGKSLLIEIVDYCLGAERCGVYEDVFTGTIGWYGLELRIGSRLVSVARQAPKPEKRSNARAHLEVGGPLPPAHELTATTSIDAVVLRLAALLGIEDTLQQRPVEHAGEPVRATLRNALAFAFQRQYEIAHPKQLFTGQSDRFVEYGIRDTLPYFLGAVDHDALDTRRNLARLRSEHTRASRRLSDALRRADEVRGRASALLREAASAGLAPSDVIETAGPHALLATLAEASRAPAPETSVAYLDNERAAIGDRQDRVAAALREVRRERRALLEKEAELAEYRSEVDEQRSRLSLLALLPGADDDATHCPFCGAAHEEPDPTVAEMAQSLQKLGDRLDGAARDRPRLREAIDALSRREAELRVTLRNIDGQLEELGRRSEATARLRTLAESQAYVRGRVTAFLEGAPPVDSAAIENLSTEVSDLASKVSRLEAELSADTTRTRTESMLNAVGRLMKRLAGTLDLQHARGPAMRLDPVRLDVVAETPEGGTRWLSEDVGAGKNWVGYHVVTLVALHRFFVANDRPVPHFLMLDQVTQAFYPPERQQRDDRSVADLGETDRTQVLRIFGLLDEACEQAKGSLQIIVTDHADFREEWFRKRVAHDWWSGEKLIPPDWLESASPE